MAEVRLARPVPRGQLDQRDPDIGVVFDDVTRQVVAIYGDNPTEDSFRFQVDVPGRSISLDLPPGAQRRVNIPVRFRPVETLIERVDVRTGLLRSRVVVPFDGIVTERVFARPRRSSPVVLSVTATEVTSGTTHNIAMPSMVNPGDLLVNVMTWNGDGDTTTNGVPTGWAEDGQIQDAPFGYISLLVKDAVGDEDGTSVNFTTSPGAPVICHVYRIEAGSWDDSSTAAAAVQIGGSVAGSGTSPNPGSLSPAWGSAANLWIAVAQSTEDVTFSAVPTNYTDAGQNQFPGADGELALNTAYRTNEAASEDPSAFTMQSSFWLAGTIAIKPSASPDLVVTRESVESIIASESSPDLRVSRGLVDAIIQSLTPDLRASRVLLDIILSPPPVPDLVVTRQSVEAIIQSQINPDLRVSRALVDLVIQELALAEPELLADLGIETDLADDVLLAIEPSFIIELAQESNVASSIEMAVVSGFIADEGRESDTAVDVSLISEPALDLEPGIEAQVAEDVALAIEPMFEVELATELETAIDLSFIAEPVFEVESPSESDLAFDSLMDLDTTEPQFLAGLATQREEGLDLAFAPEGLFEVELTTVSEVAFDVVFATEQAIVIESGTESDAAEEIEFGPIVGFDVEFTSESDIATDLVINPEPVLVIEVANESDATESAVFGPEPVFSLELAQEIDQALEVLILSGELQPEFLSELATEVDLAFDIRFDPVIIRGKIRGRIYDPSGREKDPRNRIYRNPTSRGGSPRNRIYGGPGGRTPQ